MKANEAAKLYANTHTEWFDSEGNPNVAPAFEAGAHWVGQTMIEKALVYLQDKFYFNNVFYGIVSTDFNAMEEIYEDFIKYMKEE